MSDIKIHVTTGVATVRALEDRWGLKPISDHNAKIAWEWLIENEPNLVKKIHSLGSATAATAWRDIIKGALYGNSND